MRTRANEVEMEKRHQALRVYESDNKAGLIITQIGKQFEIENLNAFRVWVYKYRYKASKGAGKQKRIPTLQTIPLETPTQISQMRCIFGTPSEIAQLLRELQ